MKVYPGSLGYLAICPPKYDPEYFCLDETCRVLLVKDSLIQDSKITPLGVEAVNSFIRQEPEEMLQSPRAYLFNWNWTVPDDPHASPLVEQKMDYIVSKIPDDMWAILLFKFSTLGAIGVPYYQKFFKMLLEKLKREE